jgi:hypothetical protein
VKTLIDGSKNWYYIQTDLEGVIVDYNKHFGDSFEHIQPFRVNDILHPKDLRVAQIKAERISRLGEKHLTFFEARTVRADKTYSWGLYEIMSIKGGFIILGIELFPSFEDGRGRLNKQSDLLRKINFSLNHSLRKHVANVEGLLQLLQINDDKVLKMLYNSIKDLNEEILRLVNRISDINE